MLKMKTHCERCAASLSPTDAAEICSLESTFCATCAEKLGHRCPSCDGELARRPARTFETGDFGSWQQRIVTQVKEFMEPREQPSVTVERLIPAPAAAIFEVLATPARHIEIDGSDTVQGEPVGPDRLTAGASFTMAMRVQGLTYRSVNEVLEFEENRRIAWQTFGEVGGRRIVGGQIWRYELEERPDGTLVKHSYDWSQASAAKFTVELPGFPERFERSGPVSLARLELAATAGQPAG